MFQAGERCLRKYRFEIYVPGTDRAEGHAADAIVWPQRSVDGLQTKDVLDVPQLESSWMCFEQREGINARDVCPSQIELHRHERRIGLADEHVEKRSRTVG